MREETKMANLGALVAAAIFASLLQAGGVMIGGIIPNFAFAAVLTGIFFVQRLEEGLVLVASAALVLKFAPGFSQEIAVFSAVCLIALLIKDYLPGRITVNATALVGGATALFYAINDPSFLASSFFIREFFINMGFALACLLVFNWLFKKGSLREEHFALSRGRIRKL